MDHSVRCADVSTDAKGRCPLCFTPQTQKAGAPNTFRKLASQCSWDRFGVPTLGRRRLGLLFPVGEGCTSPAD
eukprot:3144360-Amphidinium_carterae.1